jgi:hypothetical protein
MITTHARTIEKAMFTREDFPAPSQSPLLTRLEWVPAVAPYIPNFRAYCLAR